MKKFLLFLGMCAISVLIAQSAQAAGIGVYGTGGAAFMNWSYNGSSAGSSTDYFYGGGLIIDSNVASDRVFGYRFTGGYEQYKLKDPNTGNSSQPFNRFSMSHTFGFGIARTPNVRFWVGPQFGFHYSYANYTYTTISFLFPQTVKVDIDALGLDLLLALGINFNIGDTATIFFDLGFGYMGIYNLNDTREIGNAFGLQAKAGFMFRINDKYTASGNEKTNM